MQKGNERENVVLLGVLKDLAVMKGNEAFECGMRNGLIRELRELTRS
jgi:hypothetical protein